MWAGRKQVVIVLVILLAGCLGTARERDAAGPPPTARLPGDGPRVVLAILDSGINPYHVQFRDVSPEAYVHPSTYLPGYPTDSIALHLALNATDFKAAVTQDCETWKSIRADQWYWVPGTRIVGVRLDASFAQLGVECANGEVPRRFIDGEVHHGTGVAGRAAGATTSLCGECKIVMYQASQTTVAMERLSREPWIDLQSNSWAGYFHHQLPAQQGRGAHALARQATERMVTFAASGNGERIDVDPLDFRQGVLLGIPPYLRPAQGHGGVIVVGGHDNGELILWPGTMPHVVADGWETPTASYQSIEGNGTMGGTSGATPFAAGVFARMVLEARRVIDDHGTGLRGGTLAVAGPNARLPPSGPLSDGRLSRQEAERLYLASAVARPRADLPHDGKLGCPPTRPCFTVDRGSNTMVAWSTVPAQVPAYYFIGFGQAGSQSLETMLKVLRGEAPVPSRPDADPFFEIDATVRRTLQE
ncbi:MAG: S8 family serine peptidase [Euryarchaeota archaeon]|nr:S8 family serine peptidase [Euryarchaeota archaeon]